ncbi:MAG: hypothetical protein JWR54_1151 [Mucilaginibacter sp.]|nr:hypothetical protein [Mucilaginibacter sp.]
MEIINFEIILNQNLNMKKTHFLAVLFLCISFSVCKAQENFQPGYAIFNDGTRLAGLIKIYDDAPWYNQRFIFLKDSAALATNPNVRAKKYKVDDLKFYQVGSHAFDKVHYVDMENLQIKSLGTNDHMMERLAIGRINAHRFYAYPPDVYAGTEDAVKEQEARDKNDRLNGYKILTQKDNAGKLQNAFDYDLQKYFEDTPEVLQKYQSGGYGNQPIVAKKGLAARMIAAAKKTAFKPQEADAIVAAFNDYNGKNAGKRQ